MPNDKSPAAQFPKIAEWLEKNGKEFCEAIGVWPGCKASMVLPLSQLSRCFDGSLLQYKDDTMRQRDHILYSFLEGKSVAPEDLRGAIALLMQSYHAAGDRIATMMERERRRDQSRTPPPSPRPRTWPTRQPRVPR